MELHTGAWVDQMQVLIDAYLEWQQDALEPEYAEPDNFASKWRLEVVDAFGKSTL